MSDHLIVNWGEKYTGRGSDALSAFSSNASYSSHIDIDDSNAMLEPVKYSTNGSAYPCQYDSVSERNVIIKLIDSNIKQGTSHLWSNGRLKS